jgi:hypothetical protein
MIDYRTESRYPGLWVDCLAAYSAEVQQQVYNGQWAFNLAQNRWHAQVNLAATQPNTKRWPATDGLKWMWYGQDISQGYNYLIKGRFPDLLQDFTIALWINIEAESVGSPILSRSTQWHFYSEFQKLRVKCVPSGAGMLQGVATLNTGTLYHVAITKRGDDWTGYIDGQVDCTNNTTNTATATSTDDDVYLFDGTGASFGRSFQGYKEDVRIYNRCLNQSEIQLLARYRGIAYELKPQLWYAEAAATATIKPQIIWW